MRNSFLDGITFSSFVIAIIMVFVHNDLFLALCFALLALTSHIHKTNY